MRWIMLAVGMFFALMGALFGVVSDAAAVARDWCEGVAVAIAWRM